jgi:predicted dehydrogenase
MIHDLYGMRHVLGPARRVLHTDIWNDGWAFTTLVECDEGVRCAATWVELPHVRDFKETLEVCGDDRRVLLGYPTGFARGILSTLQLQELDENGHAVRSEPAVEWENAFVRELKQFHACITLGVPCRTPLQDARLDVALIIDIVRAHLDRNS